MLQYTYDRFARLLPKENIYVVTNEDYESIVREQLPELTDERLLSEPIHRGTAPSMIWASHRIFNKCRDARILVTPSDLTIVRKTGLRLALNAPSNLWLPTTICSPWASSLRVPNRDTDTYSLARNVRRVCIR